MYLPTQLVAGRHVHSGAAFDVYQVEAQGRSYAFKTSRGAPGGYVFQATATLGNVSTIWDVSLSLGESWGGIGSSNYEEFLVSEHARVTLSDGAWNHRTLGLAACNIPTRGECVGLLSDWVDGASLDTFPLVTQRRLVVGMLTSLWDALKAAGHGDIHPSNIVIAPGRERFSIIDPAAMIWGQRGQRGCSIGASWVSFTTHGSSYPLIPPYSGIPMVDGASLRDYAEGFLHAAGVGSFFEAPVGVQTMMRIVSNKPLLTPPNPNGSPLAADWHAVGVLYYAALTGCLPFGESDPAWHGVEVLNIQGMPESIAARVEAPVRPPSALNAEITPVEDELALGLLRLSVDTRAKVADGCARVADALGWEYQG